MSDAVFTSIDGNITEHKLVWNKETGNYELCPDPFEDAASIIGGLMSLYGHKTDHNELKELSIKSGLYWNNRNQIKIEYK